ncbi:MAG: 4Fe-4S dicluster domain-containing protein [Treponema sp.]|nr:4Fe-4S dicluster domain-containing protein [Treponema sp.]
MKLKYLKDVSTLSHDDIKCAGCGKCMEVCPHGVFQVENGKSVIIDKNSCMECGACARNCPMSAIDVEAGTGCAFAIIMSRLTGSKVECSG